VSKAQRKSDKNFYNNSSADFVPIACHYDMHTLLTKNGELVQSIQINGINSDKISKDLMVLRNVVRKAIRDNISGGKFAFWVHTIRRKDNIDDMSPYPNTLSGHIHSLWRKKNYWDDKFVNKLYISIVISAAELKIRNMSSIINSLFPKMIVDYENKHLAESAVILNETVDNMLLSLQEYGATKIGVRIEGDKCYSDSMFLYRRIIKMNETQRFLNDNDLSESLASYQYSVGNDKMEVIEGDDKKFAAILSIKEYQEISSDALDRFLQIPVEMISTEVFYFVDRKEVAPLFADQDYLLSIGGDKEMRVLKGIDKIIDASEDAANEFCHQQISIMIIGDNIEHVDNRVQQASETLSRIGIVHVREDINLEKTFWAQLPGNFSFLARMSPTILNNTAALASLHNFPTGNQYNPWGKALTLLRTERGTPYFMNLHDLDGKVTNCIFGPIGSGKTVLTNFLVSEADKYKPTIMYLTSDSTPELFIKAKAGNWTSQTQNIINPLTKEDSAENREFMFEFFKIISQHYFNPLNAEELAILQKLSDSVFALSNEERKLSEIIISIDKFEDSLDAKSSLTKRFIMYLEGGDYYQTFETDQNIALLPEQVMAFSLQAFDDDAFTKEFFPKEQKLVGKFEYDLNIMRAVKAAIVWSASSLLKTAGTGPKILVLDNMDKILNLQYFSGFIEKITNNMASYNCVFLSSVNIETLHYFAEHKIEQNWMDQMATSIIFPPEIQAKGLGAILKLDPNVFKKLSPLTVVSRMFVITQDQKSIMSELSIGGFPGITGFLSARANELALHKEIVSKYGDDPANWTIPFYEALSTMNV